MKISIAFDIDYDKINYVFSRKKENVFENEVIKIERLEVL
jgi:hypothetical protein